MKLLGLLSTFGFGWSTASILSAIQVAQSEVAQGGGGQVELSWTTIIIGYGPLGIFALGVAIDKIGNHSERNRLREENKGQAEYIKSLHARIEDDIVPAILGASASQNRNSELLVKAIDSIEKILAYQERQEERRRG